MQSTAKEYSGSSLPLSGTLELPSDRPASAHSAQLAATSCETREIAAEKRERRATPLPPSTAGCVGWVMGKDAYIYKQHRPCFNRELVYAKVLYQPLDRLVFAQAECQVVC
jgi:hypothetical protein